MESLLPQVVRDIKTKRERSHDLYALSPKLMKPIFKNENMDKGMLIFALIIVGTISALEVVMNQNILASLILVMFAVIISSWFIY